MHDLKRIQNELFWGVGPMLGFQQIPEEFSHVLWNLAGLKFSQKYSHVLEIGVATGYSALAFNHFFNVDLFTLIDDGKHLRFNEVKKVLSDVNYSIFIGDSTSKKAVDFVKSKEISYDLIHIDANHEYDYISQDFDNYSQFLSEDGVIVLHGTLHLDGPRRVLIETYKMERKGFKVLCNIGNRFGSAIIGRNRV